MALSRYEQLLADARRTFLNALAATDPGATERLRRAYDGLLADLDTEIARFEGAAGDVNGTRRSREAALRAFRERVAEELNQFARVLRGEMATGSQGAADAAAGLARELAGGFGVPDPRAIRAAVDFLERPAMGEALAQYGSYHADAIGNMALRGLATGKNALKTAREAVQYLKTMPIADANRFYRTITNYSLREGVRAGWETMGDLVRGWTWVSARDKRCCMSCIAKHGSTHSVKETLNDHHLGRCGPVAITQSWADLGFRDGADVGPGQTGEQWFNGQGTATQIQMMGRAKWMAWRDGAFGFDALSTTYQDAVYGTMRTEASLIELVGEAAAQKYQAMARRARGN